IREREPGESVIAAFRRFVLVPRGMVAAKDPAVAERHAQMTRGIMESPALLAREQQILSGYVDALAELLAEETDAPDGSVEPWVVASALMGVHRALLDFVRRELAAGTRSPKLSQQMLAEGRSALDALERGLGDYGVKPGD